MTLSPRLAQIGKECVACGSCLRVCPRGAIHIASGVTAQVNSDACGRCAKICPADVITIVQRRAVK